MDDNGEQLLGVVYLRELTEALLDGEDHRSVDGFRHEMVVVPPTLALDALLSRLQEHRMSICAVVDEYGYLLGVISAHDVLRRLHS